MNILKKANEIVNERSEDKERMYGGFDESMEKMRDIFNVISGNKNTTEDMYMAMVAMKLARHSNSYKEDNLLDAVAYIGALNNYIQNKLADDKSTTIDLLK